VTPTPSAVLEVFVDLGDAVPGVRTYPIDASSVRLPPDVDVVAIEPPEVEIELERLQVRTLAVEPEINGEPAPGFQVERIAVNPTRLTVEGPESLIGDLDHVATTPVSIDGATSRVAVRVEPRLQDPSLRVLTVSPITVRVEIVAVPSPETEESP
jgi:YbbR domain-containing protein